MSSSTSRRCHPGPRPSVDAHGARPSRRQTCSPPVFSPQPCGRPQCGSPSGSPPNRLRQSGPHRRHPPSLRSYPRHRLGRDTRYPQLPATPAALPATSTVQPATSPALPATPTAPPRAESTATRRDRDSAFPVSRVDDAAPELAKGGFDALFADLTVDDDEPEAGRGRAGRSARAERAPKKPKRVSAKAGEGRQGEAVQVVCDVAGRVCAGPGRHGEHDGRGCHDHRIRGRDPGRRCRQRDAGCRCTKLTPAAVVASVTPAAAALPFP